KLYKRWHIGTGYNQWKAWGREKFDKVRMIYEPSADRGDIKSREGYKMIDLYVYYKLPLVDDRHSLNIGIGPSRCWGDDIYLIDYVINPHPPYDIIFYEETRHKSRYGITNHLNYSFLVAKGRFQVGFDV